MRIYHVCDNKSAIYYVITVKDTVVTVEMYAKLNDATTYYFAFGDSDPVSFKTASNKASEVAIIEIDKTQTFTVDKTIAVKYALKNKDGVELKLDQKPTFTVKSGTAGWFTTDNNLYFFEAGKIVIEASFDTGEYDEANNKYITVTDTAEITASAASAATLKSQQYSVEVLTDSFDVSKENHTIRMGETDKTIKIKFTYNDDSTIEITPGTNECSIKSVDETICAVMNNKLIPVNQGSTTIVLYQSGEVVAAYPVQVLEANKGATASVKLSKNTLNINDTLKKADGSAYTDEIGITYTVKDLNGADYDTAKWYAEFTQVDGNKAATEVGITGFGTHQDTIKKANLNGTLPSDDKTFKTIRIKVEIKERVDNALIGSTTISFTVGNQSEANACKLKADKTALDTSVKNYGDATGKDPAPLATIVVENTKTTSQYGDFACGTSKFEMIEGLNEITATGSGIHNYVVFNQPTNAGVLVPGTNLEDVTIDALPTVDITADRIKSGTYTLSGYHVEYDGAGNQIASKKTSLGNASVVVSNNDVKATAVVVKGKASDIKPIIETISNDTWQYVYGAGLEDIIKVTWDGKNSSDHNSRVFITEVKAIEGDTGANHTFYVRAIKVKVMVSGDETMFGEQEIAINTLFKDE